MTATVETPSAVIDRVSLVLDAFDGPGRLRLAQIVRRTGLPPSSAHRMLERLVRLRWLRRSGRDYELGMRLVELGSLAVHRHHTDELRFLVHWSAEVFVDYDELKKNMDGSDDLTIDKAIDMLVDDVHKKGIKLDVPCEPLHDPQFIGALNAVYDLGGPATYPQGAPLSALQVA